MNPIGLIQQLEATTKRTDKEQAIFAAFMGGERAFFIGAALAYDPLVTFGVKRVALIEGDLDDDPGTFTFQDFLALAGKLRRRELTGHAARDAINNAAGSCHMATWNLFYRRILLKDLKAGVEDKTINKVLARIGDDAKDFIIPIFSCQLAQDGAKPPHSKKLVGRKLLDVKLDGVRLLTILDKEAGTVTQFTRNGKQNENFTEITEALKGLLPLLPGSIVLDGEIVSTNFQDLMTQVNRRDGVDTSNTRLALFDIIPLTDFRRGLCVRTQEERHAFLSQLSGPLQDVTGPLVYIIPKVEVDLNTSEGMETYREFNRQAIEAGYEGFMAKEPTAPYVTKRSDAWLKVKPFIEVTLVVDELQQGEPGGKYANTLGALVCAGVDDGRVIEVNVGSGLSDEQRALWWSNPALIKGFHVEIRADAFTQPDEWKGTNRYSLRFPRFKGVRGTEPGEKL